MLAAVDTPNNINMRPYIKQNTSSIIVEISIFIPEPKYLICGIIFKSFHVISSEARRVAMPTLWLCCNYYDSLSYSCYARPFLFHVLSTLQPFILFSLCTPEDTDLRMH